MKCGAPGMCGHRRDCPDKHCPGRYMEPLDMDDAQLVRLVLRICAGAALLSIAGLALTLWKMFA